MRERATVIGRWLLRVLGNRWCWWILLGLFSIQTVWFILSAPYPMAFDENYHFGLIELHSHQWLPFFTYQPEHSGVYGEVVRDPSYLFHWLMSFPYRLLTHVTHNQTAQIIVLRFINFAIFVCGVLLYRRIVRRLGASEAVSNAAFALFLLIPIVPFLAATINYDNLFFLGLALSTLLVFRLLDSFKLGKVDAFALVAILPVLLFNSLVKYTFLPIFLVTLVFLLWRAYRAGVLSRTVMRRMITDFRKMAIIRRVLLVSLCLLAVGLFAERYVPNVVRYHNPVPACSEILTIDECKSYGPFDRDYVLDTTKPASFHPRVTDYALQWFYGMWYRLYFAVNYDYATAAPLLIISRVGIVIAAASAVAIMLRAKQLFVGQHTRQYLLYITLLYSVALFVNGFQAYVKTSQPVAINGRYLLPFLPFLLVFGLLAWKQLLHGRRALQGYIVTFVVLVTLLQGGGAVTFLIRSHDEWFWDNTTLRNINRSARSVLWYTIPFKDSPTQPY